jgi:hypothetical protein
MAVAAHRAAAGKVAVDRAVARMDKGIEVAHMGSGNQVVAHMDWGIEVDLDHYT